MTHILSTILLLDIFRNKFTKHKKKIKLSYIYIAGLFSIVPDFDYILYWIIEKFTKIELVHRMYSHSILIPMIMLVFTSFMYNVKKKWGRISLLCTFAYFTHIILDYLVGWPPYAYFWPFISGEITFQLIPIWFKHWFWWAVLDTVFLVVWLLWELKNKKIKDFT